MPRHPPCALKNLTTKINKYYRYRENHDNTGNTPIKGTSPDHQVYLKLHLIILRCSRPLCSSQTTTPSHPATTTYSPWKLWTCAGTIRNNTVPVPPPTKRLSVHTVLLSQDPTVCQTVKPGTRAPAALSNHNHPHKWERTRRTHAARLNAGHLLIDIPPLSTHRRTNVFDMGISCKDRIQHCGRTQNP
jgi:hypothetical protein